MTYFLVSGRNKMSYPGAAPANAVSDPSTKPYPSHANGPYADHVSPNYSHQGGAVTTSQPVVVQVVPQPNLQATANIKDYMAMNIMFMLCCCLPFGIVAVIKSNECQKAKYAGDVSRAKESSAQAKKWGIITLVFGLVFLAISIGYYIYAFMYLTPYLTDLSNDLSNYWCILQDDGQWYRHGNDIMQNDLYTYMTFSFLHVVCTLLKYLREQWWFSYAVYKGLISYFCNCFESVV